MWQLQTRSHAPEEFSAACVIENVTIKIMKEFFKGFR
jgi:hypothetical protein